MIIVNKKFLYVPMGDNTVQGFSIDRTSGALTAIPGPFSVAGVAVTADDVATDPAGRFLFVGSEGAPNIWVFTINSSTGALTATAGSPFTGGLTVAADEMTVDASGKFLYAGQTDPTFGVAGFSIDQTTGALTSLGNAFALGVAQIHASPTAEILLGVQQIQDKGNLSADSHIYVYVINPATGAPAQVGSPTGTLQSPFDFAISPNGIYVYALEQNLATSTDAPIEGFMLNTSTGALASMGTFSGVPTAGACHIDQGGVALFCIDSIVGGTTITVNAASPTTGALSHVADLAVSPNFPFAVTD
jgi:6-phosphogluconolactonase (cycloisomerase 2 family)